MSALHETSPWGFLTHTLRVIHSDRKETELSQNDKATKVGWVPRVRECYS